MQANIHKTKRESHVNNHNLGGTRKRGKLWLRLCIDLKHIKLRNWSKQIAHHALTKDCGSVKTGVRVDLLRIYNGLAAGTKSKKTNNDSFLDQAK